MTTAEIEFRCPQRHGMFFKLLGTPDAHIDRSDNTIEVVCRGCRDHRRRQGEDVEQVKHTFNLLGELLGTVTV